MNAAKFTYRVTWSEEDQNFVGLCAEFPSLSWLATSQDQALKGIRRTVDEVIKDMAESGEPIPEPHALRAYSGKFQVRIPPETHRRLAIAAAESGVSLNRLISQKLAS